ncbi:glycosyl transferase family protein [mine drainage metagenome]|uniref:Glycosyl transferase family protein n=1 Tax=mine drainage metagenome TaxID=410659 RepID=T1BZT9_9ZZZZ
MSQPLSIAALVLNYRRADLTARCVASLGDPIRRIYVIDNSDDPWEAARLESCLREGRMGESSVRILTPPTNLGFARGMAFGLEAARSEQAWDAYWIMNNDATAGPDLVSGMVAAFEAYGRHALVAPRVSREGVASRLWYQRLFGLVLTHPMWGAFPYLNGACLLVPAEGATPRLFDTDFFLYGEDVELSWRLSRQGFPLIEVNAEYHHEGHAATQNGSLFYEFHTVRGHLLLARKLAVNRGERWLFMLGRMLSLPARASVRSLRNRTLVPWQALIAAGCAPGRNPDPPRVRPDASR